MTVKLEVVNSNAFGGVVKRGSVDDLEKFLFDDSVPPFSKDGMESLLRTSKIPVGFFNKHPEVLQKDLLASMKNELRVNELLFLQIKDKIEYVAPSSDIDIVDPIEKFNLNEKWSLRSRDLSSGIDKYVYKATDLIEDDYAPAVFMEVPILYNGKIKFESGMYKVICTNGLLDRVNASDLTLKVSQMNPTFFDPVVTGILSSLQINQSKYNEFLNYLRHCPIDLFLAKDLIKELTEEKIITNNLNYYMMKYFNLVQNGKQVDPLLPTEIKTHYDIIDSLTYYTHRLPTHGMRSKTESNVFSFFYKKYAAESNLSITKIDLKRYLPQVQVEIPSEPEELIPNIDSLIPNT